MGPQELHSAFEAAYSDWRRSLSADGPSPRSDDAAYIDNAPFAAMVALGPRAAPLMVQKLRTDPEAHFLVHALWRVTRKQFPPAADGRPRGNQGLAQLWVQWAAGGYRSTSTEFSAALEQWRSGRTRGQVALWTEITRIHEGIGLYELRTERDLTELGQAYQRISDLGIDALPLVVQAVVDGQTDLVVLIPAVTGGAVRFVGTSDEDLRRRVTAWWEANKQDWLIPWPEEAADE